MAQAALRVVLVAPRNPLNIGAAARAMHNFGFHELRLVNAYDVAVEEVRSAVHALDILRDARQYASVPEAVADCSLVVGTSALKRRDLQHNVKPVETGGGLLREHLQAQTAALLFGSEKFGLSNEDLSYCHWLMTIGSEDSMNLGQAVAVCLYELTRREMEGAPMAKRAAGSEALDRLTERAVEVLAAAGYVHSPGTEAKVRRLVRRMQLDAHDADAWLGVFRQIAWKLGQVETAATGEKQ